jgi:hypothetical protein
MLATLSIPATKNSAAMLRSLVQISRTGRLTGRVL